jgi:hypothetical protein
MRKYSKFIVVAGTLAALTVPSVAMADAPSGYSWKDANQGSSNGNPNASIIGQYSSRVDQNGQSVSQQTDRGAIVQALLGHTS